MKKTKDDFLKEAREKFGNRFEYNLDEFVNYGLPITITEVSTGESFTQSPTNHFRSKNGKPEEKYKSNNPTGVFRIELQNIVNENFGVGLYQITDSCEKYLNNHSIVNLRCVKHGIEFSSKVVSLKQGHTGCPDCYRERLINSHKKEKSFNLVKMSY